MELQLPASDDWLDNHLESLRPTIHAEVSRLVVEQRGARWYFTVTVRFARPRNWTGRRRVMEETAHFSSPTFTSLQASDIDEQINFAFGKIMQCFDKFLRKGSGWIFEEVLGGSLFLAVYRPLEGSSYIPTPRKFALKKAVINVQNSGNKCFLWSVLAALHPMDRDAERVSKYQPFANDMNCTSMVFPLQVDQVKRFANLNNISINVFGYEEEVIFPMYICENGSPIQIDLLYISNEEGNGHYCLIRNMSRLLGDLTKHKCEVYYCRYCLHGFSTGELLLKHDQMCREHDAQRIQFPQGEKAKMRFRNPERQLPVPFIIYADFECFSRKVEGPLPEPGHSSTTPLFHFTPSGFCFVVVNSDGIIFEHHVYRGEDAVTIFLEKLLQVEKIITPLPMICL